MKKIYYLVSNGDVSSQFLARTPEGAVKQFLIQFRLPVPPTTSEGGWEGITVEPVGGYKRTWSIR